MPKSCPILDSSPIELPDDRPSLKRSASMASLPTPPRTLRKRKSRSRSKESSNVFTDSEGEVAEDKVVRGKKRRRTSEVLNGHDEEDSEEEFWLGSSKRQKTAPRNDSSIQTVPYVPLSPPSSRRQTLVPPRALAPVTPPRARTSPPKRKSKRGTGSEPDMPIRDSPNNPFLVSDRSPSSSPAGPRTPEPFQEKERITYVFRGMKREYPNPFFNRPASAGALSVDHPDYEAPEACPPKLLFPSTRSRRRLPNQTRRQIRGTRPSLLTGWESSDDEARDKKKLSLAEETALTDNKKENKDATSEHERAEASTVTLP